MSQEYVCTLIVCCTTTRDMSNPSRSTAGTEQQHQLLIYPEGEADAVTITVGDVEGLKPTGFLSDNVIDFYIKFLQREPSFTDNGRCHFFNSFFFTKLSLVENSKALADEGKVGYEQVRKWTGDVNLFEKDYVFIPINRSSHWSLIIICHLRCLASSQDEGRDSPCILHLDSYLKGEIHNEGIETHIRNYIAQAWMEKYQAENGHQVVSRMKFVQTQAPQQENRYDCGIYLLHYVELFLKETTTLAFASNQRDLHFVRKDWFKSSDVSSKRMGITNLISRLCQESEGQASQTTLEGKGNDLMGLNAQPTRMENTPHLLMDEIAMENRQLCDRVSLRSSLEHRKRKRDRNWTVAETSILIKMKIEFSSRTCKGTTDWAAIAAKMPTRRTRDQCRLRWDSLIKSYKEIKTYCIKKNKNFCELTKVEGAELKLATTMSEDWWYEVIDQSCQPWHRNGTSLKLNSYTSQDPFPSHLPFRSPIQLGAESSGPGESSRKRVATSKSSDSLELIWASDSQPTLKRIHLQNRIISETEPFPKQTDIPGFNCMSYDLKCTLLNLIQAWPTVNYNGEMEAVCRWLAIIQDRKPTDTRLCVLELVNRNIVKFCIKGKLLWLELGLLRVYKKFAKKAIRNRYNVTQCHRVGDNGVVTFESMLLPKQTRVLTLLNCLELKRADLGNLPMLRSLVIKNCPLLEDLSGWETLGELRWLEIDECRSYRTYPKVHCLASLREARFERGYSREAPVGFEPSFRNCFRLSRLEVWDDGQLKESGDLSTLKCLQVLSFINCPALGTINGLSGLQSLTKLNLGGCKALRRLPGLEQLKALEELELTRSGVEEISGILELHSVTHLDLGFCKALQRLPHLSHLTELYHLNVSGSGVQEISGIEELHSLTKLDLSGCEALQTLPYVGHLTALAQLHVDYTGVEEIVGVENLSNLEVLDCYKSKLKTLPDLRHLPLLQCVYLFDTPVTKLDVSSIYFEKGYVEFNQQVEADDEVSDISDHEYIHSDEELYRSSHGHYSPRHPGVWH